MRIKYLKGEEKQKTRKMWEDIFNTDSQRFIEYYYKEKVKHNKILVLEEEGKILSMLQLNPYKMQFCGRTEQLNYIVGVATEKNHRKRGYMRKLLVQSVNDMYKEEQPFTFLMPADENIYIPFDFHYIYDQKTCHVESIKQIESTGKILIKKARESDIENICNLADSLLRKKFNIYICKDYDYVKNLLKEAQASEGFIPLLFHNDELIGYGIYEKENDNQIQIREPLCKEGYEEKIFSYAIKMNKKMNMNISIPGADFLNKSIFKIQKKPLIMARIINLNSFLKNITCKYSIMLTICISDNMIADNDGIFRWSISRYGSTIEPVGEEIQLRAAELSHSDNHNIDIRISIRYLTAWLFGYTSPGELFNNNKIQCSKEKLDILKLINTYGKVFINEVV